MPLTLVLAITAASAVLTWVLITGLRPWLLHVALAKLEARSSHRLPTPQGAGLAVFATVVAAALTAEQALGGAGFRLYGVLIALAVLVVLGFYDDARQLGWRTKLAVQAMAAALAAACLPAGGILPAGWAWLEWATAVAVMVAMINLVNFIDGIDEITIAHAAPGLAVAVAATLIVSLPFAWTVIATATLGGLAGFWPLNRHPARVFLGDAGSLPLGLLLGWFASALALGGHIAPAALMVMYPLADGSLTLLRRWTAGKRLTEAHRDHAYQNAVDAGRSAPRVAAAVAVVSLACAALAVTALLATDVRIAAATLVLGAGLVLGPIGIWLRTRS